MLTRKVTNNDETFTSFVSKQWAATVKEIDEVMTEWEKAVESADNEKVAKWANTKRESWKRRMTAGRRDNSRSEWQVGYTGHLVIESAS